MATLSRTPEKRGEAGGSGDGGIDGIIKEDRLGLEDIYLQANR
ncbi:MAG: restriction endonuclease [Methanothrix sp.]|jgi:restriction endonuclease Mrr|nr:restriction endonuclease [Methanothrix sp.]MBK7387170.1 restriction endonuclease [Methanothrix sp.]